MINKTKKIIFVGGGTLGHIAPSIPVIKKLKEEGYIIYFFTTLNLMIEDYLNKCLNNKEIKEIVTFDLYGFKRNIFNINSFFYNIKSIYKYMIISKLINKKLKEINPDLVIGMGGYISGFVLKNANRLKYKTIIHEQNAYLGLSNKIVLKDVEKILLSFDIVNRDKRYQDKYKIVGNPSINEVNKMKNQEKEKQILVTSGSIGSSVVNDFFIKVSKEMKDYHFTIITGKKLYDNYKDIKSDNLLLLPFTTEMNKLMNESSLIISRSGSSSLFEILGLEKISILIPSPYVTNNHQLLNAKILNEKAQAVLIEEKDLDEDKVIKIIKDLEESYWIRENIIYNIRKDNYFNSLDNFIREIEDVLC